MGETELTKATHNLYALLTTSFQEWQLWIHNNISKTIFDFFFSLFQFFYLIVLFFVIPFQTFMHKKHHVCNLYRISYILSFCYIMYDIVSEICIGGRFLEDYFYCYSQELISAIAIESLIPYNFIKRVPEKQNL